MIAEYFFALFRFRKLFIQCFIVEYKIFILKLSDMTFQQSLTKKNYVMNNIHNNNVIYQQKLIIYIDHIDLSFHLSKMLNILLSFFTEFLRV